MDDFVFVSLEDDLKDEKLTLRDYDIHTLYVSRKVFYSNLPLEKKIDCFMLMNAFRSMILDGNFVESNIRRVNQMVRRGILGEEKAFTLARKRLDGERI